MSKVAPSQTLWAKFPLDTTKDDKPILFFWKRQEGTYFKKMQCKMGKKNQSMTHLVYRCTVLFLQCSLTTLSQRMPQDSLFLETQLGQRSIT